jgi:hypothetical protein
MRFAWFTLDNVFARFLVVLPGERTVEWGFLALCAHSQDAQRVAQGWRRSWIFDLAGVHADQEVSR